MPSVCVFLFSLYCDEKLCVFVLASHLSMHLIRPPIADFFSLPSFAKPSFVVVVVFGMSNLLLRNLQSFSCSVSVVSETALWEIALHSVTQVMTY